MISTTANLLAVPQKSTYVIAVILLSQFNENVVRWIFLRKRQSIMNRLVYTNSIDLAPTYIGYVYKIFMKE